LVVGCSLTTSLDGLTGGEPDSALGSDVSGDTAVSSDGPGPVPMDAVARDQSSAGDGAFNSSQGCGIPTGVTCGASLLVTNGHYVGIACADAGPTSATFACGNPAFTGPAVFIQFATSGGPFKVNFGSVSGPFFVMVMNACGGAVSSCTAVAAGAASGTIQVAEGAAVAIGVPSGCSLYDVTISPR
jgi:hypothetical protein